MTILKRIYGPATNPNSTLPSEFGFASWGTVSHSYYPSLTRMPMVIELEVWGFFKVALSITGFELETSLSNHSRVRPMITIPPP